MSGPSLTDLRKRLAQGCPPGRCGEIGVRRLWWAALETLQQEMIETEVNKGIWVAAPLPALYEPQLLRHLEGWVWAPEQLGQLTVSNTALPDRTGLKREQPLPHFQRLPLQPDDGDDPLLLVITPRLQVALALDGTETQRQLLMRCDPGTLSDLLSLLDRRLQSHSQAQADHLRSQLAELGILHSDEGLAQRFWPRLAEQLTDAAPGLMLQPIRSADAPTGSKAADLNLLEALTHEVRTPLATIRTLIRSLLRRKDLTEIVLKRLRQIDAECSEQINRFGLIFHAAELQRQPGEANLAKTDLESILRTLSPGWNDQLAIRGIDLQLDLESGLPAVLSDSRRLEPMLGGLIDRSSRGLPEGSALQLRLQTAGARVKLQLHVELPGSSPGDRAETPQHEELGTVLSWDPSTGSLQLSQGATRQMMESLGGRYQHRRDRDLTVFFPVHCETDCKTG